jgi:hypothetical protein
LQFFVGSGFANHNVLKAGADPSVATNYSQRYSSRLTYGINIPVLSAIKQLAAKAGGASSSSTSSNSASAAAAAKPKSQ